jgi:hypothetical protein
VHELQFDLGVCPGEDSEYLIGERLSDARDAGEIEYHGAKQVDSSQDALRL